MRSTPHAHTNFVDGKNTPLEMVRSAISKGFASLGFSEHGVQEFDFNYALSAQNEVKYIEQVLALKREYAGHLAVHLGIELDQYGTSLREKFEYVIGSKHYFANGEDRFAADGAFEDVAEGCERFFGGDWYAFAARYFREFADFITGFKPDIIGHFDLIVKHNRGCALFDENDPRFVEPGLEALERMAQTGALLEVNTGAIARGYRDAPYPALGFLKYWREKGGRAIVSSDCHDAAKLDAGYDAAYALLKAAGYKTAWALGAGDALFVEYKL